MKHACSMPQDFQTLPGLHGSPLPILKLVPVIPTVRHSKPNSISWALFEGGKLWANYYPCNYFRFLSHCSLTLWKPRLTSCYPHWLLITITSYKYSIIFEAIISTDCFSIAKLDAATSKYTEEDARRRKVLIPPHTPWCYIFFSFS